MCASRRRSPCGERGLKSNTSTLGERWHFCRSPCGERGLKSRNCPLAISPTMRRSPCGERGLKCEVGELGRHQQSMSLPVRGAWIEIRRKRKSCGTASRSLPVRGAWIEISAHRGTSRTRSRSLPVRGAWIEMLLSGSMSAVMLRRSPCGERGLKSPAACRRRTPPGRSPCGERGLKCEVRELGLHQRGVAPRAGSVD